MARRNRNQEIAFGSDSFLDIVANIVGILIILIVVAGVRVSQTPAPVAPPPSAREPVTPAHAIPPVDAESEPPPMAAAPQSVPEMPPPDSPPLPQEPPGPPKELLARVDEVTRETALLAQTRASLASQLETTTATTRTIRQQVAKSKATLAVDEQHVADGRHTVASLQTQLETGQRDIAGLHLELAEIEASAPPSKVLRHKLTPVGSVVNEAEVHFLLSQGRIALVPLNELAEKLKDELRSKRSQLLRGNFRVGRAGPVKGFVMEYVVERDAVSLVEELRQGTAVVRVSVSRWQLLPQPGIVTESADEALLPHSRFLNALRAAGPNAALTFWVYPDSFALYRELMDFAHDNGFDVAGRPLPDGIPITGSPTSGSRSVAQ